MPQITTRILAVLELLQTHGRISGAELAQRLEVDARTLRRYIVTLEDMGIPITAERGRHGGYALVTGFKLPPMMFTDDETLAVSLGLEAVRSLGLAQAAPAVASARAKLERVMPEKLRKRVRAISETTTLDISSNNSLADHAALGELTAAAQSHRRVHLHYHAPNGARTERDFDPYGLVYREGHWYVTGYCHLRKGLRSFRLDRVRGVMQRDVQFERPVEFNAAAYLAHSIATIPRAMRLRIFLHTDLKTAIAELHDGLGILEAVEGGVMLQATADTLQWFARRLCSLPFAFDVLEPVDLRSAVRAHAEALLARHAE